ncbi:MAG: hypothetical protein QOG62_2798, partial [Thermoleophilaceae bacterium]|nr:hypothetical protein [Thermoleophilaceae bacterium]
AGPRFTAGTLAAVAGLPEPEVMASLREAVEHSVVTAAREGASDAFAFRHALVQEAIYGDLLPADRTRIHVAFAAALERGPAGPERTAELAHHYYAAHDLPAAIQSSMRAAEAATAVYAFADGHLLYERALELWPQVPNAETLVGMDRIDLLVRAADAAWASAPPRAVALVREAIADVDPDVDPARAGTLQQRLCQYAWSAGDGVTALEAGREAVRLVPADPPTVTRAWALARLGQILMVVGFWSEAIEFLRAAIEAARAAGAPGPEGHAFDSLGVAKAYLGDVDGGLADLRHSIEIGIAGGTMEDLGRAYENIVDVLSAVGRFAEAEAEARLGFEYDESHGMTQYFGSTTLAEGGLALIRAGRWREAAELVQEASEYAIAGVSDLLIQQRLALLDVGQGRFDSARRRIERLHEISGRVVEAQMVAPTAEAAAELACWEGRFADASGVIAEALDRIIRIDSGLIGRVGPLYALGLRAEAEISIANRRRHVTAAARELSARAQRILDDVTALHAEAGADRPAFAHLTGAFVDLARAEIARVDGAQADQWAAVARTFEQIPMRSWRAYALWREGEALLAARQPRAARDALERAHGIAVELEALPLRQALEAVGARARIDLTSDHGAESRPSPDDQAGLTKREREVLALVAEGRTNREIASLLFISGKTAGVHVSNILGKLGVSGRTEAAAVARRRGLID